MSDALFPVWTKWDGCVIGEVWRRVLFVRQSDGDVLMGYLSLLNGQANFNANWEEPDGRFVFESVGPFHAEGISSSGRAVQWAEWLIADMGGEQRQRAPRRKRSLAKEAA